MSEEKSFMELMAELEAIVADLEKEDLDIEKALEEFEAGVAIFRKCQEKLSGIEAKTRILKEANGEYLVSDMEG